jgi:16S rRNA (cytidine1402-2'-O)-methyltransferase
MANFYIVSTPIGNLEDISKRALRTLKEVDLILCEDTRVTKKLLNHFDIKTPTSSYHQHSKLKKINFIIEKIKEEKNLALVSDAGTPGISDPGNKLIEEVVEEFADSVKIIPIPGPSALISALSISGLRVQKFTFLGFPPAKRKRKKFFEEVVGSKYPVVFYESPHRIIRTLEELEAINNKLDVFLCRELTKIFETTYRGNIAKVLEKLKKEKPKGEFVVIIKNNL